MKLRNEIELEVEDIGENEEIKSKIADKDMGLALTMMSKNLYSDPIGSFIREITSNAVDANVDANVEEPVMVHLFKEEDTSYIEFKDNGVGMSPDTFKNIYMSWFNSDKRDTNDKIGGWGLGSKSPLAYRNFFEIITRSQGVKYHYVMSNESVEPKCDLIHTEPTEEGNGTTIRLEIKDGDDWQISQECERQLAYFKTVYVLNELYYYDNNFKIYEKGLWKLRNQGQPFQTMHICLGQVSYPINWEVLKIDPIRIPVALNFDIGDLEVTVSREEINYTDLVKEKMMLRIEEVMTELSEIYNNQIKINDLGEYFNLIKTRTKPELIIEDVKIKMTGNKAKINFKDYPTLRCKNDEVYKIFSAYQVIDLRSKKTDNNFRHFRHLTSSELNEAYLIKDKLNFYDTLYIEDGTLFKRKSKITRTTLVEFAKILGLVQLDTDSRYNYHYILKPGASAKILSFIKYVDKWVETNLNTYDGICPDYIKEDHREAQRQSKELRKEHITYYNANNNRESTTLAKLLVHKYVFYVSRDKSFKKKNTVKALYGTLNSNFINHTKLIYLSATAIKKLNKYENVIPFEEIFNIEELANHFYKYKISQMMQENIKKYSNIFRYSKYYTNLYNKLSDKFYVKLHHLVNLDKDDHSYRSPSREEINLYEEYKEYFDNAVPTKNYDEYKKIYSELREFITKVPVLSFLKDSTPKEVIFNLIKGKGITKLNEEYYKM